MTKMIKAFPSFVEIQMEVGLHHLSSFLSYPSVCSELLIKAYQVYSDKCCDTFSGFQKEIRTYLIYLTFLFSFTDLTFNREPHERRSPLRFLMRSENMKKFINIFPWVKCGMVGYLLCSEIDHH